MRTPLLPVSLVLLLALNACDRPTPLDPGSNPSPNNPGGVVVDGGGLAGDPLGPPTPPPIVTVDPSVYALTLSGSFSSSGTSTGVLFLATGSAMWNQGTCSGDVALGTDGTWTYNGTASAPHNSKCIGYWSDGRVGANNKGTCIATSLGFIGLWRNPGGHKSSPYHTKCLMLGTVSSTIAFTFTQAVTLYTSNDGKQKKILNFTSGSSVTGQLVYSGPTADYTTGTGSIAAVDGDGNNWSVDLGQAAFHWYTGAANGDVIAQLQGAGVEAIACNSTVGCVLTTVKLGA